MKKLLIRLSLLIVFFSIIIVLVLSNYSYSRKFKQINQTQKINLIIDGFRISESDVKYVVKNSNLTIEEAYNIVFAVYKYSKIFNLDPKLILKIIKVESNFNQYAESYKGAKGLMQIMPETFDYLCQYLKIFKSKFDIYSVEDNILVGCFYIRLLLDYNDNNLEIALRKYYAGRLWSLPIALVYYNKILKEKID